MVPIGMGGAWKGQSHTLSAAGPLAVLGFPAPLHPGLNGGQGLGSTAEALPLHVPL